MDATISVCQGVVLTSNSIVLQSQTPAKTAKKAKSQQYYKNRNHLFRRCRQLTEKFDRTSCLLLTKSEHDVWHAWRTQDISNEAIFDVMDRQFHVAANCIDENGRLKMEVPPSTEQDSRGLSTVGNLRKRVRELAKARFPSLVWTREDTKPDSWPLDAFGDVNRFAAKDLRLLESFLSTSSDPSGGANPSYEGHELPTQVQHHHQASPTSTVVSTDAQPEPMETTMQQVESTSASSQQSATHVGLLLTDGPQASSDAADALLVEPMDQEVAVTSSNTRDKATSKPPNFPIGTKIKKKFGRHGWFDGVVVQYKQPYYKVFYPDDNDSEQMTRTELLKYIKNFD
eukprot:GILK01011161.1.p1 GENE.GILK01011161.1~~GILK01011161.1.p1  ORF type:complete len:342 (+),score=29.45 GILK01011161.1:126-1151(+)